MRNVVCRVALLSVSVSMLCGADWRQFRGNDANGIADESGLPVKLSDPDVLAWSVEIPGQGVSGPIVVGDRVFVTSSSGYEQDRLHVSCFDVESGRELWHRQFWATGRTQCHNKMAVAAPTPASDGERIFAFYSCNDLACLDLDGNLLWFRGLTHDYPNASNSLGMASSPMVIDDTLIVQVENDSDSFATGIDIETGMNRWKVERKQLANWSSPTKMPAPNGDDLLALLQSSAGISAVDPLTGNEVWNYDEGASTIPSSVVVDDKIIVPSGGVSAIRLSPESTAPETLWSESRLAPKTASLLAYGGSVYSVNSTGILSCADIDSGKIDWKLRLKGAFSATPVVSTGHMYLVNEDGVVQVVSLEGSGKIVDQIDLESVVLGTPAIADDALYIRGDGKLWKFSR